MIDTPMKNMNFCLRFWNAPCDFTPAGVPKDGILGETDIRIKVMHNTNG
jgi:hypothetical protein